MNKNVATNCSGQRLYICRLHKLGKYLYNIIIMTPMNTNASTSTTKFHAITQYGTYFLSTW